MSFLFEERKFNIAETTDVSLFGAFPGGGTVRFMLKVNKSFKPLSARMIIHADGWNTGETILHEIPFTSYLLSSWRISVIMS